MGLFSGSPDLDSPSGVTDYMLRNDKNPAVRYFKKDKGGLTLEIEAAWTGKSREQRLGELKNATRYFLMFTQPDTTPFDKLPPQLQTIVALAAAKSRILGFLWERNYGESMVELSKDWGPFTPEEIKALGES